MLLIIFNEHSGSQKKQKRNTVVIYSKNISLIRPISMFIPTASHENVFVLYTSFSSTCNVIESAITLQVYSDLHFLHFFYINKDFFR